VSEAQSSVGRKQIDQPLARQQSAMQARAGQIIGAPGQAAEQDPAPSRECQGSRCAAQVVEASHVAVASSAVLPRAATRQGTAPPCTRQLLQEAVES